MPVQKHQSTLVENVFDISLVSMVGYTAEYYIHIKICWWKKQTSLCMAENSNGNE